MGPSQSRSQSAKQEAAKGKPGPGVTRRAALRNRAANGGRAGQQGPKAGNRNKATSGRYTPPIPKERRKSPAWFGIVLLVLLVLGLLLIVLNYVGVLPSGTHNYYLLAGIVAIVVGLVMATFYH